MSPAEEIAMAASCSQCGAALGDRDVFCTKCGAKRSTQVEKHFCAHCGNELKPDLRFCEACGTRVELPGNSPAGSAAGNQPPRFEPSPTSPPFQPVQSPAAPSGAVGAAGTPSFTNAFPAGTAAQPPRKSSVGKILIAVMAFLLLIVTGIVGTGIYIGYRIKKKAEKVEETYKKAIAQATSQSSAQEQSGSAPDLGKLLGAVDKAAQGQTGSNPDLGKLLGAVEKATQGQAGNASDLEKMLQAVEQGKPGSSPDIAKMLAALSQSLQTATSGNFESRPNGTCPPANQKAIVSYISDAASSSIPFEPGLTLTNVWTPAANQPDVEILISVDSVAGNSFKVSGKRLLGNASSYQRNLCNVDLFNAREYETAFGTSTPATMPGSTMFTMSHAVFSDLKAGRAAPLTFYEAYKDAGDKYDLRSLSKGTLSRVETSDVPYSIIVNGEQKNLPTLHVKGDLGGQTWELWVLDDVDNPLVLNLKVLNSPFHITYVKITFPEKKKVEQQLAQTGHADIYGIYFDFNKATPRPESAPVLKEIAQALKDNPNWKLEIAGHTDNVGGNSYNMSLSDKRAQGVMQSLVTQYGIAADRLTAKGFGDTEPKATNDTVEGRALNRRVELVRD